MLTCPKCVSELTLPALGDTTTCPGCGLVVHISSLSPGVDGLVGRTATASYPDRNEVDTTRQVVMPKTLGRYDVETLLGTGGFSHVYLAHDKQLDRRVALKVMRPDRLSEQADVRALFEEARIAARLEHSGFVPVYDVAQDDAGRPFLVMKYLPGQSLRERIVAGRMSATEVAQVIRKISLAMHFAHKQRLVHRDLKPSNILFDAEGEPHVADLGLAVTEQSQIRRAGEWAGTLPYMAPEQVRGETQRLDGRCDIWSIGVIFYELLTGLRPFRGEKDQIGDEIQNREPRPPRQLDEQIPAALEAMCLKCLRKSLHDRYLSAFDLAEDLSAWLTGSQSKPSAVASGPAPAPSADSAPAAPLSSVSSVASPPVASLATSWRFLAGVAIIVLLASGGVLIARNGLHEPSPPVVPPETPEAAETKPDDSDVVPANAPPILLDELAPLRWHPLLTVPPEKLVWGNWPNAHMTFDASTSRLTVDTPDVALLALGEIGPADFRLQMEFAKSVWVGDIGFFLGYQAADPAAGRPMALVQILAANSHEENGKLTLRLEHQLWRLETRPDLSRPLINRSVLAGVVVTRPDYGREASLELSVRERQIANVRWCGQDIPELVNTERLVREPPLAITGPLGIVAGYGAVIVSDVRLLLTREKEPAREP